MKRAIIIYIVILNISVFSHDFQRIYKINDECVINENLIIRFNEFGGNTNHHQTGIILLRNGIEKNFIIKFLVNVEYIIQNKKNSILINDGTTDSRRLIYADIDKSEIIGAIPVYHDEFLFYNEELIIATEKCFRSEIYDIDICGIYCFKLVDAMIRTIPVIECTDELSYHLVEIKDEIVKIKKIDPTNKNTEDLYINIIDYIQEKN